MTRTMQTSTDVGGGGTTITKAGTYHCQILQSADGQSTKGNQISGCSALLSVLAGTESDQVEKQFHLTLFDPDLSKSDSSQEWAIKKQTAYGIAINQIDPSKLGEACEVDFGNADGQQIIISIDENEHDGKKNLQLAFANIYHVDDPRAKAFPKNKEAMALLPSDFRKPEAYFQPLSKKSPTGSNGSSQSQITNAQLADL